MVCPLEPTPAGEPHTSSPGLAPDTWCAQNWPTHSWRPPTDELASLLRAPTPCYQPQGTGANTGSRTSRRGTCTGVLHSATAHFGHAHSRHLAACSPAVFLQTHAHARACAHTHPPHIVPTLLPCQHGGLQSNSSESDSRGRLLFWIPASLTD